MVATIVTSFFAWVVGLLITISTRLDGSALLQTWPTFQVSDNPPGAVGRSITPELSAFIERNLAPWNISGIAVAVVRRDGTASVSVEMDGWGNKSETGDKMTPDTLFHIASCSKAFLASAMGILMDDYATGKNSTPLPPGVGAFNWETKIKDVLPGWALLDTWATEKVNIRDILGHVSGLPRHDYSFSPTDSPEDVVSRMKYLHPIFELRQKWSYNNQMYLLGSHIISTLSGLSYTSFVKDRIFDPLNMSTTTFSPSEAVSSGKMTQSWTKNGRRIPEWATDEAMQLNAGAAGIISSVADLTKWITLLLNSGVDPDTNKTIVPLATFEAMTTAYSIMNGVAPHQNASMVGPSSSIVGYGMGWVRQSYLGHEVLGHDGGAPGFGALVALLPSDGLGTVVLVNADDKDGHMSTVTNRIIVEALNLHPSEGELVPLGIIDGDKRRHTAYTHDDGPLWTPIPLSEYSGSYSNPGYNSITLCGIPYNNSSGNSRCSQLIVDFAAVDNATGRFLHNDVRPLQLVATWRNVWTSHLRLVHTGGNLFGVEITSLYPQGYGADTTPFETVEIGAEPEGTGEFVVKDGKVVGLGIKIAETKTTGPIEDRVDVWFTKDM